MIERWGGEASLRVAAAQPVVACDGLATRARGLAAAPCHGASGAQPRARCGHLVSRGSSSPPVAPHSVAAINLRAAEPHVHVASPPHSSSGRAEGTIGCARDRTCSPPLVAIDCRLSGLIRRSPVPPLLLIPTRDFGFEFENCEGLFCEPQTHVNSAFWTCLL